MARLIRDAHTTDLIWETIGVQRGTRNADDTPKNLLSNFYRSGARLTPPSPSSSHKQGKERKGEQTYISL
ncbi:hypothetical protein Sjap_001453 [Stephania japonica]|uniref:Uncharacterized protein n=1 Tax=Stephania japonica TaxID=461633 RepID=A0AAP0KJY7_9MAGN